MEIWAILGHFEWKFGHFWPNLMDFGLFWGFCEK
jgi:hypothetical protein